VKIELVVRDGTMRRQVFRRARLEVVAQIGVVRESDPQSRTRIYAVLLEQEKVAVVVDPR
jgi:hypothetical protein